MIPISNDLKNLAKQEWFPKIMKELGYIRPVTCNKCKWWRDPNEEWGRCGAPPKPGRDVGDIPIRYRPKDYYCADSERKEDESTRVKQTYAYIGDLPSDPIELIKSNDEINFENSLNAEAGRFRYRDPLLSYYLERAQWTITVLSKYIEEENHELPIER